MAPLQTCGHVQAPAMITIEPKATRQPTATVISRSRSVHATARIAGPGHRAALPHLGMGLLLPLIIVHKHDDELCRSCLSPLVNASGLDQTFSSRGLARKHEGHYKFVGWAWGGGLGRVAVAAPASASPRHPCREQQLLNN